MNVTVTQNNKIIFEEKNMTDDRYEELLYDLKTFDNKQEYNLFISDYVNMECINLTDIFD